MTNPITPQDRLLRMPQLLEIVPLGKSTIWAYVRQRKFPAPVKISSRCTVWKESEIQAWLAQLAA
ncbi:MAG: AlpA family phage regulatory protein [Desulfuromonadaceae bacterium]|nr:AlpA family phage regulatory protein [Desulfuromonadaceae bacterium]